MNSIRPVRIDVLIETYWNVKYTAPLLIFTVLPSINRNILECKGTLYRKKKRKRRSINRNILECKGEKTRFR